MPDMDHYLELTIFPDAEIAAEQVLGILFGKLHLALVEHGKGDVGVSFPDMDLKTCRVGARLRLHGTHNTLEALLNDGRIMRFRDYAGISQALPVPAQAKHRSVFRVQEKGSNPERLRRRAMKRHGLTEAEARARIPDTAQKRLNLPSLQIRSHSSGQSFRIFFDLGAVKDNPSQGKFNTYGLSRTATVPWF
jgi:CRISPR-associated endonuclease Csy4